MEPIVIDEESLKLFLIVRASLGSDKLRQSKCCSVNEGAKKEMDKGEETWMDNVIDCKA